MDPQAQYFLFSSDETKNIPVNFWKFHGEESAKMTIFNGGACSSKVIKISMGEMFGNFLWFKEKILKIQEKIGRCP